MKKVYFVRHGESEYNKQGLYSGSIDTKLTELGIQQAREVGKLLKDRNIRYILSSSLSRAQDTALYIKEIIDSENVIEMQTTLLLREVFFGDIQGKPYGESSGLTYAIESGTGESAQALYERGVQAFELIQSVKTRGNILVVGHGSFSSVIFAVKNGMVKSDLINYRKRWLFKNGEVKIL